MTSRRRVPLHACLAALATAASAALASALAAALLLPQPAQAGASIDRPIVVYVGGSAGGGIDLYARLIARHIGRHIPGAPTVTVQDMPGAGGIKAANYLAKVAPRDGTVLGSFSGGPILEPLTGARHPGYGMDEFTWIGAVTKDVSVCVSWGPSPFKSIDDVIEKQMIVAGTGSGSESDLWPKVVNDTVGTKFKIITGYPGTQETLLAMENGEVDGRCGWAWSSLKASKPEWLRDGKINLLIQIALQKNPDLAKVPFIFDLLSKEEDRQLLALLVGPSGMSRPYVGPPGLPAETSALLRRAYDATMTDPAFLTDAAKMQVDVAPTTGEEAERLVHRIYATPPAVLERAKKLLNH
jgi:tripartite-type tricarboxylate transporter receptor subunit TctC